MKAKFHGLEADDAERTLQATETYSWSAKTLQANVTHPLGLGTSAYDTVKQ